MSEFNWILQSDKFKYQMLSRLKMDCDYYLGNGNRNKKHLWAENEEKQFEAIKEIWNTFSDDDKPEWLTREDISNYEIQMTKIKDWYESAFPTDELGCEIKSNVLFSDLFVTLDNGEDVYEFLGVDDSIVRERVFGKLSEIMNVEYSYIYNQWLNSIV